MVSTWAFWFRKLLPRNFECATPHRYFHRRHYHLSGKNQRLKGCWIWCVEWKKHERNNEQRKSVSIHNIFASNRKSRKHFNGIFPTKRKRESVKIIWNHIKTIPEAKKDRIGFSLLLFHTNICLTKTLANANKYEPFQSVMNKYWNTHPVATTIIICVQSYRWNRSLFCFHIVWACRLYSDANSFFR